MCYVCTSFWNYSSMPTYEVYVPIWARANIDAHMPTLATCWHTMKEPSDSHQNIPPCSTPNVPPVPQIGTIPAALHVETYLLRPLPPLRGSGATLIATFNGPSGH